MTVGKWVSIVLVLLLIGGGFFVYSKYDLTQITNLVKSKESSIEETKQANNVEVLLSDTLIPVNDGRHQKLLLLDLSIYTAPLDQVQVEKSKNHIRHALLNEFSTKSTTYFYDRKFVSNLQKDVQHLVIETMGLPVDEVLVTKAIYQ